MNSFTIILFLLCVACVSSTKINVFGPNLMAIETCWSSCGYGSQTTQWTLGEDNVAGSRISIVEGRAGAGVDQLGPVHFDNFTTTGYIGNPTGGGPVSWSVPAGDYIIGFTYEGWGNMPKNFKFHTQNGVVSPYWGSFLGGEGNSPYSSSSFPGRSNEPVVAFWGTYCWCGSNALLNSINAIVQMDDICTDANPCGARNCTMSYNGPVCSGDPCEGVVCASSSCQVGTCNPSNGQCEYQNVADGTSCDDSNLCTQTDECFAGTCVGSNPVVCADTNQCQAPGSGVCHPTVGACQFSNLADGTPCELNGGYAECLSGTCQQDLDLDNDCLGGFGVQTPNGCSCKSGFAGSNCEIRPDPYCAPYYHQVQQHENNFQSWVYTGFYNNHFIVYVYASLEENSFLHPADSLSTQLNSLPISLETEIQFGSSSNNSCNYPTTTSTVGAWEKLSACEDIYVNQFSWDQVRDSCGFSAPEGGRSFTQTIRVVRRYKIAEIAAGEAIYRTESSTRLITISFPSVGVVDTGGSYVQVTSGIVNVTITTALSSADYDPFTGLWTVEITSLTPAPYKLASISSSTSSGALATYGRLHSASMSDVSCTGGNYCRQRVTLHFVNGLLYDNCVGLDGQVVLGIQFGCDAASQSVPCTLEGTQLVTISATLHTTDSCPINNEITFSQSALNVFQDAGAQTPATTFTWDQTAYFGSVLTSTDADIVSRSVSSVCAYGFDLVCNAVSFAELPAANGYDPIFSIDLNANRQALEGIMTSSGSIRVRAVIEVGFEGVERSSALYPTQSVNVEATFTLNQPTSQPTINSSSTMAASAFLITLLLFILV